MDQAEFDRLITRARDPRLIPGIYNYCDGRCRRCAFTQRCLTFLDNQEMRAESDGDRSLADLVGDSLQRTLEMLAEAARREGVDLDAVAEAAQADIEEGSLDRLHLDPLVAGAREYGHLASRIGRAIAPLVAARGDSAVVEAVDTIDWFSTMIGAKLYRAVCGQAEGWEGPDEAQTDFNGSAKIALIAIGESSRAWAVLMESGRATADGVPALAVKQLAALEAAMRERFPRVMEFVRPGFDQAGADGGGQ
jgi:hypothetical protein